MISYLKINKRGNGTKNIPSLTRSSLSSFQLHLSPLPILLTLSPAPPPNSMAVLPAPLFRFAGPTVLSQLRQREDLATMIPPTPSDGVEDGCASCLSRHRVAAGAPFALPRAPVVLGQPDPQTTRRVSSSATSAASRPTSARRSDLERWTS